MPEEWDMHREWYHDELLEGGPVQNDEHGGALHAVEGREHHHAVVLTRIISAFRNEVWLVRVSVVAAPIGLCACAQVQLQDGHAGVRLVVVEPLGHVREAIWTPDERRVDPEKVELASPLRQDLCSGRALQGPCGVQVVPAELGDSGTRVADRLVQEFCGGQRRAVSAERKLIVGAEVHDDTRGVLECVGNMHMEELLCVKYMHVASEIGDMDAVPSVLDGLHDGRPVSGHCPAQTHLHVARQDDVVLCHAEAVEVLQVFRWYSSKESACSAHGRVDGIHGNVRRGERDDGNHTRDLDVRGLCAWPQHRVRRAERAPVESPVQGVLPLVLTRHREGFGVEAEHEGRIGEEQRLPLNGQEVYPVVVPGSLQVADRVQRWAGRPVWNCAFE
mmetsp:Transcript_43858/g.121359  ORF Transcript_43858/g.121359 Transcript_43858/m.121359 type:complete len:389 (+) Transcript_43858:356-1522(+)